MDSIMRVNNNIWYILWYSIKALAIGFIGKYMKKNEENEVLFEITNFLPYYFPLN